MRSDTYAVILAGGRGERLWPLTATLPKQFLPLLSEKTLLQETFERIRPLVSTENICISTGREWVTTVYSQLPTILPENVIAEPIGRNTAPCIGLAAMIQHTLQPDGIMVVLPADHAIHNGEAFRKILSAAIEIACESDRLLTLGVLPNKPATGYGYIERGSPFATQNNFSIYQVNRFTEKPNETTAKYFFEGKQHWWNSGIFIWKAKTILEEISRYLPQWYTGLLELKPYIKTTHFEEKAKKIFQELPGISIDYGVMEKTDRALVIPADIGWSDIGDWQALAEYAQFDNTGNNAVRAQHIGLKTENSIIYGKTGRIIGTLGVRDLIIVDTEEALLVMHKDSSQELRQLVEHWNKLSKL
jgi:mannose-1-phosphate guanylyltransferase